MSNNPIHSYWIAGRNIIVVVTYIHIISQQLSKIYCTFYHLIQILGNHSVHVLMQPCISIDTCSIYHIKKILTEMTNCVSSLYVGSSLMCVNAYTYVHMFPVYIQTFIYVILLFPEREKDPPTHDQPTSPISKPTRVRSWLAEPICCKILQEDSWWLVLLNVNG